MSVKVEGKHQIVIDNANAIGYLATTIANNLKEIEEHLDELSSQHKHPCRRKGIRSDMAVL